MQKKLNLDRTKTYEIALATEILSRMVVSYVHGRECDKSLGSEQGDIEKWDDLVLLDKNNITTHFQIKRQNTDFSTLPLIRSLKRGSSTMLQDLSPFDESMEALGKWTLDQVGKPELYKKKFKVELPDGVIEIKSGIPIHAFSRLVNDEIKLITTPEGFERLISTDPSVKKIAEWLKSWCSFKTNNHILETLKRLSLHKTGYESDIFLAAEKELATAFNREKEVCETIKSFITDNSTFSTAITPRILFLQIQENLHHNLKKWTQYRFNPDNSWDICGIHDCRLDLTEKAEIVVPSIWDQNKSSELRIDAPLNKNSQLSNAIIRLALHMQGASIAYLTSLDGWRQKIKNMVGGTLGLSAEDLQLLNTEMWDIPFEASDSKNLQHIEDHDNEADELSDYMLEQTWNAVKTGIKDKIFLLPKTSLRQLVESRWAAWESKLDINKQAQKELMQSMLNPKAEGEAIEGLLRVGPKTVFLIANGIFTLIIVSVAKDGTDDSWQTIGDALSIEVKANRQWSGPCDGKQEPRKLTGKGHEKFLAAETSQILVLSEVDVTSSDFLRKSIADDNQSNVTLASARQPKILITANLVYNDLVENGDLDGLKVYFNKLFYTS